ncbi:MAG: hypothetical protein QXR63_06215, partial [Candidatus Bathyarchaeia archaeon]
TDPSRKPLNKEQENSWVNRLDVSEYEDKSFRIIRYVKLFVDSPLLAKECLRDPLLRGMEILKQPQGTNFPLTIEQWNRILELINNKD